MSCTPRERERVRGMARSIVQIDECLELLGRQLCAGSSADPRQQQVIRCVSFLRQLRAHTERGLRAQPALREVMRETEAAEQEPEADPQVVLA